VAVLGATALLTAGCQQSSDEGKPVVRVGSKAFVENVILEEMAAHLARGAGARVEQRSWLGDTSKPWFALQAGDIDVYCEYTGTLRQETLSKEQLPNDKAVEEWLEKHDLRMSKPLGFNNTYAIALRRRDAEALHVHKISDLTGRPDLHFVVSNQFHDRADGWKGLQKRYHLPDPEDVVDHTYVYAALASRANVVGDVYSTDPQVKQEDLQLLEDSDGYFPSYNAILLYRADLADRAPAALDAMLKLQGAISEDEMRGMNARVQVDHVPETQVAAEFLEKNLGVHVEYHVETVAGRIWDRTLEHLLLVAVSLALGIVAAVPLGVAASRQPWLGHAVLAVVGALQTVPALALLVLLVVCFGRLGVVPAVAALFCYSLLPIVRNTYTGLRDIPPTVRESADALGLSSFARLRLIDLPLASRSILAGIKTAAVITVGNATLGGLIGARGYGETIYMGLNKLDWNLLLEGAVPAVVMALVVQGLFDAGERFLVPKGLRLQPAR
jgi:osmoprotectant transport system permease protein